MKTKKIICGSIIIAAIVTLVFVACKKDISKNGPEPTKAPAPKAKNYVSQKLLSITAVQSFKMIKWLKNYGKTQNKTANLIEADSVKLDSAIYVLEAALNFDFDDQLDTINVPVDTDTTSYTMTYDISSDKVNSDDLENAYTNLKSQITSLITTYHVQVVDINTYISDDGTTVTFDAEVAKVTGFANPCGNVSSSASPFLIKFMAYCSSGNPSYDAPFLISQRIACSVSWPLDGCAFGTYWDNIKNPNAGSFPDIPTWLGETTSPTPSFLFNSGNKLWNSTTFGHCAQGYKNLTATQVNNFTSAAKTEIIARIPTTPASMQIIQGWMDEKFDPCLCIPANSGGIIFWNLRAKYGVLKCRPAPRST